MYNYVVSRISCRAIALYFFITGACLGGLGGILLGLMEKQAVSILGGAFLGLLLALAFAVVGLVLAAAFNILAPWLGGIGLTLATVPTPDTDVSPASDNQPEQQSLFPGE